MICCYNLKKSYLETEEALNLDLLVLRSFLVCFLNKARAVVCLAESELCGEIDTLLNGKLL